MVETTFHFQMITIDDINTCGFEGHSEIEFSWHFTNWCNYKCSYCPVLDVLSKDFKTPDHAQLHKFILTRLSMLNYDFNMCLSGGEPTLNPALNETLVALDNMPRCQRIAVMTNLAKSIDTYRSINALGSDKIVIMASYHPEYFSDRFVDKAMTLSKEITRFKIMVNFSDDPKRWDELQEVMDTFTKNGIKVKPNLLTSNKNWTANYTKEFYDRFVHYFDGSDQPIPIPITTVSGERITLPDHQIEINKLNRFKGFNCTALSFNIDIKGHITNGCTGRQPSLNMTDIVQEVKCPKSLCQGRQLLKFYKKR